MGPRDSLTFCAPVVLAVIALLTAYVPRLPSRARFTDGGAEDGVELVQSRAQRGNPIVVMLFKVLTESPGYNSNYESRCR
jgi:hypothetical protein